MFPTVALVALFAGCHDAHDHGAHDDEARAHGDHADTTDTVGHADEEQVIHVDDAARAEFGIVLAPAEPATIHLQVSLAGEVVLNPDRVAHVAARAGGIGADVLHAVGDRVKVGGVLAVLDSPELAQAKADYLSRAAQAALAVTDLERAEIVHANTLRLLDVIASNPDIEALRKEIADLDIGANRGDLITDYARMRSAEATYRREKALFDRQISSESDYLDAESELKEMLAAFQAGRDDLVFANQRGFDEARRARLVADVSLRAAERRLHALGLDEDEVSAVESESDVELARYMITAPITGRIIERHLVRGESVESGAQVFVIADLSSVWGMLTLYQRDLAAVREGQGIRVLGTHDVGTAQSTIDYISPILDERTRTTTARIAIDNPEGIWRPGMFVRARLNASEYRAEVTVPRSALLDFEGATIVFVEHGDGIEPRAVRVGRMGADRVEIIDGVSVGNEVVVSGALALRAELTRSALEHAGHAH